MPKVGDRVLVEAQFNANMPFKWNATSVKVLNYQAGGGGSLPGSKPSPLLDTGMLAFVSDKKQICMFNYLFEFCK